MATEIDVKFSEFTPATELKDSARIPILQDGENMIIPSPVLESKIINKTVSRVIEQGGASLNVINLKGVVPTYADLATITPIPELNDAYQVEADGLVYVYTENGFQAEGEGFKVQPNVNGVVEEGNENAVSGGEVYNQFIEKIIPQLERGGIENSSGINGAVNNVRLRTINKQLADNITRINVESTDILINSVYFYNNGVFVSNSGKLFVKNYTIIMPPEANEIRVSFSKFPTTEEITEQEFNELEVYYSTNKKYNFNSISNISEDYDNIVIDFNSSANELGGITTSSGSNSDNNIRIRSKSFVEVVSGQTYKIQNVTAGYVLSRIFRYLNGVYVSNTQYPPNTFTPNSTYNEIRLVWEKTNNTEVITPEELNDFDFNIYSYNNDKLQTIAERSNKIPFIESRLSSLEQTGGSNWVGKKMASIGNSITFGFIPRNAPNYPGQLDSYAKLASQKLGMSFNNYGISGSTLGQVSELDTTTRSPMIYRYNVMPNDADLITFSGGTNDLRNISQLGTMEDRIGWTWYGALHILMQGLLNKYVYNDLENPKTIVAVTPIKLYPNSTHNSLTIKDYRDAMIEVANYYAIPVFDAWALSGMTPEEFRTLQGTEAGYTDMYNPLITDGVHPTQEGHEIYANAFVGFLKTLK